MDVFWDGCVNLSKKCVRGPPPKVAMDPLFAVSRSIIFCECFCFRFFVSLGAQEFHCGSDFDFFLGAAGLLKNRWKCVSVVKFRGLAPSWTEFFPGLDCECVLKGSFCRDLQFQVVLGRCFVNTFGTNLRTKSEW